MLLKDDVGRDDGAIGLSGGKKLDLRLRGDGEGGIWERVSMVLSDREGLGRRELVRDLIGKSGWRSSILPAADVSTACGLVAVCCIDWLVPLSILTEVIVLVSCCTGFSGKVRSLRAYLVGSGGGGTFTAVRGRGNLESLGIPDAWRFL